MRDARKELDLTSGQKENLKNREQELKNKHLLEQENLDEYIKELSLNIENLNKKDLNEKIKTEKKIFRERIKNEKNILEEQIKLEKENIKEGNKNKKADEKEKLCRDRNSSVV